MLELYISHLVSTNWFAERSAFIMVFQEGGSCSVSPFKCLHLISDAAFKALTSKALCQNRENAVNIAPVISNNMHNNSYPYMPYEGVRVDGVDHGRDDNDNDGGDGGYRSEQSIESDRDMDTSFAPPIPPPSPPNFPPTQSASQNAFNQLHEVASSTPRRPAKAALGATG